jgi:hypothetical protein
MRIRFWKVRRGSDRFAWLPKRMSNGTIIWLEPYRRTSRYYGGGYTDERN